MNLQSEGRSQTMPIGSLTEKVIESIQSQWIDPAKPGNRIPTEKSLADQYQVSVTTIRNAVSILCEKGKLQRCQGIGTFVCSPSQALKVGILIPEISISQFYAQLGLKLAAKLTAFGYGYSIYYITDDQRDFQKNIEGFKSNDILVICGYYMSRDRLDELKIPYILTGTEIIGNVPTVSFNLMHTIKEIVVRLYRSGCRNIRLALDQRHCDSIRSLGFLSAFHSLGITPEIDWIGEAGDSFQAWQAYIDNLLANDSCDAIIAKQEKMAAGLIQILTQRGIGIPQDISIVGSDNLMDVAEQAIPITTIDFNLDTVAELTVKLLENQLEIHQFWPPNLSLSIPLKIIKRNSTRDNF